MPTTLKLYKSYSFRNKDPVIDELRTLTQDEFGGLRFKHLQAIEYHGGPSASCMRNWFHGKTKRPQSASIEAAGRALGYKRVWQRFEKVSFNGKGKK